MTDKDKMQGEGDKASAENYREATEEFIDSGKVNDKAREATQSSRQEKDEMKKAEEKGKERARK